jgi:hypothetical protein
MKGVGDKIWTFQISRVDVFHVDPNTSTQASHVETAHVDVVHSRLFQSSKLRGITFGGMIEYLP